MTEYMKSLRRLIGHAPVMLVGASVILLDGEGRVLLQRRSDNKMWGYHGGAVELGEAVEEAAARELYEETGLVARSLELYGVFSGKDMHYVYPNGDEVYNIDIVYICRNWEGTPNPQLSEVDELRFFALSDLPADISPPNRLALYKLAAELGDKNEEPLK